MHLIQLSKNRPRREQRALGRLSTATCLLALAALQPGAQAQVRQPVASNTLPPNVRKYLLEHTMLPDGRIVRRNRRRALVPLNTNLPSRTSPSESVSWRNYMKQYPFTTPNAEAYTKAILHRDRMPVSRIGGGSSVDTNGNGDSPLVPTKLGYLMDAGRVNISTSQNHWFNVGPFDLTPPEDLQVDLGVDKIAGRVNGGAFDSRGNLYVATASGGIWRFLANPNFDPNDPTASDKPRLLVSRPTLVTDYSTPVSPAPLTDYSFPASQTSSIAVDPKNDSILYVGLGDYNLAGQDVVTGDGTFSARQSNNVGYSIGIMKSVNGGKTWANIGNGRLQPITVAQPYQPVMEGTAVSSIIVDLEDSKRVLASSGRGLNPGSLWVSTDAGNKFRRPNLLRFVAGSTTTTEVVPLPFGDWSNIDYGVRDNNGNRLYYAALVGDGIYRSFDRGETWVKLNVPLVYNDPNRGGGVPFGGLQLGMKVAASKKSGAQGVVYVFDASGGFNDGRVFKTLNANVGISAGNALSQPAWVDITGSFVRPEDVNNFSFANYDTTLAVGQVVVPIMDPDVNFTGRTTRQEVLYGGQRYMSTGLGAVAEGGGIFGSTANGVNPIVRDDLGVGQDWTEIAQGNTHAYQHAVLFDNRSPLLSFSFNDGGVYQLSHQPGWFVQPDLGSIPGTPPQFFFNATFNFDTIDPVQQPNADFRIAEFYRADFFETEAGAPGTSNNKVLVVGSVASNAVVTGELDFTNPASPTINWTPFKWNEGDKQQIVPDLPITPGPGQPVLRVGADGNPVNDPDGFAGLDIPDPKMSFTFEVDNVAIDPSDPTGKTQYMITAGNPTIPWGDPNQTGNTWKSLYMTTDGWVTFQDISPDRWLGFPFKGGAPKTGQRYAYVPLDLSPKRAPLIYVFNRLNPADTTTGPAWTGESKPYMGMPIAFGFSRAIVGPTGDNAFIPGNPAANTPFFVGNGFQIGTPTEHCMYTGGQFLWRFDPRGSSAKPKFPPGPIGTSANPAAPEKPYTYEERVFPNEDRGVWRRVSPALASGAGFITCITVGSSPTPGADSTPDRIYVGTSTGDVWISRNGTELSRGSVRTDFVATSAAAWRRIAGPGVAGNTLPNRPVTSISINTDSGATQLGDILVTLGGATGVPHVWRATNTTGASTPIFTAASGQGFASLPDAPVNGLVRDPDDATNTLFAATDLGVYTSIDGGATWSNATAPLKMPNVEVTSIKVVPTTPGVPGTRTPRQLYVSTFGRGIYRFDLSDIKATNAKPNLNFTQNFTRNGSEIIVNISINNSTKPAPGESKVGTAFNVVLKSASIKSLTRNTSTTSIGLNGIVVGTIAPGQSQIVTVRFPATAGKAGEAVFFNTAVSYTLPPFPPGTPATKDNSPGFRTRLP